MADEGKGDFKDLEQRMQEPQIPAVSPQLAATATIEYCYGNGWRQMWKYFGELLLIFIVNLLLGLPNNIPYLGIIYLIFVGLAVSYGAFYASLKAARDERPAVGDLFVAFKINYWNTIFATLLTWLIIIAGFILLIVPGVIFFCKLSFVPYLVIDKKMGAIDSIKKSWQMTTGYSWTIFFILLLAIPIIIAGIICLIVGIIPAAIWIWLALASVYSAVAKSQSQA